jgi:hypothetical protein
MRILGIVITGMMFLTTAARAAPPPPRSTVEMLIHLNHGLSPLAGKEVLDTWEQVRQDPEPYLPFLKAHVTLERIEAAEDPLEFRSIQSALWFLFTLGGMEERAFMRAQVSALSARLDSVSPQMMAQLPKVGVSRSESEERAFQEVLGRYNRLSTLQQDILRLFAEAKDPSLRDVLVPRLEHDTGMLERYIDYFLATCREDPYVRFQLHKLLEAPSSLQAKDELKRFFDAN